MKYIKTMHIRALAKGIARGLPSHVVRARYLLQSCLEPQRSTPSSQQPPRYVQVVSAGSGNKICTVTIPTDATISLRCFLGSALFEHGLSQHGLSINNIDKPPQFRRTTWSFCCLISDRHNGNSIDLAHPANTFCLPEIVVHRYSQEWICAWKGGGNDRLRWIEKNKNPKTIREMVIAEVIQTRDASFYFSSLVNQDFEDDREIMELAVLVNPLRLKWASARLRNDREIVKAAVACAHYALDYTCSQLNFKADREIALIAVRHHGFFAFQSIDQTLHKDPEIHRALDEYIPPVDID